jgi:hypothetical protein
VSWNARRVLVILLLSLFAVTLAAGCGGGSHDQGGEHRETDSGEPSGEEGDQAQSAALERIPQSDRDAFLQLATAIGTLRARAAPVAVGSADRLGPAAPIVAARAQVLALRPTDAALVQVRKQLIPVLRRFAGAPLSGTAARRAARSAIAAADRIEAGLRRYSRTQPAIGGVIPD